MQQHTAVSLLSNRVAELTKALDDAEDICRTAISWAPARHQEHLRQKLNRVVLARHTCP